MSKNVVNLNEHIWEGWTVGDFIEELEPFVEMIMTGNAITKPFANVTELANWCKDNQPYYKKTIQGVVNYFATKYNIN